MKFFNKIAVAALLALVAVSASAKGSSAPKDGTPPAAPCMIAVEYGPGKKEYFNANLIARVGIYTYVEPRVINPNVDRFEVSVHAGSTFRSFSLPNEAAADKFAEKIVADIEAKCK